MQEGELVIPDLELSTSWASWLEGKDWLLLEPALAAFLERRRWFSGKARSISRAYIAEVIALSAHARDALFIVCVDYVEGPCERYHVPLAHREGQAPQALVARDPGALVARLVDSASGRPRAVLFDAFGSADFCRVLLGLLLQRRTIRTDAVELKAEVAVWLPKLTELSAADCEPRVLSSEQSNTSVVFGDRLILKMFRRAESGTHPDLELSRFLTERGFTGTPRLAGWLEYVAPREPYVLAVVHEFVAGAQNGWEYTRAELKRYFERVLAQEGLAPPPALCGSLLELVDADIPEPLAEALGTFPALAELLARRTAELHVALASDSSSDDMAPEPYGTLEQRSTYQALHNLAQQVFRELRRGSPRLPPELAPEVARLLASERQVEDCFAAFREQKMSAVRIRQHGDYHLGQVLYTGKDFLIIDLEGEPGRPLGDRVRKRSALRDVAGMLRSFHYAMASTLLEQLEAVGANESHRQRLEVWAGLWYRGVARAFLKRYLETARGAAFLPVDREELSVVLNAFLVEKALYELSYELSHRPSWLPIPLRGIQACIELGVDAAMQT